jgi:uroporphyrinogen-III decarboxylase
MNSLERVQAMLEGRPFDKYPVFNPHAQWYLMPHWPQLNGKCFLHPTYGSNEEKIECWLKKKESLGIDFMFALITQPNEDTRWSIEYDGTIPTLVNLKTGDRESFPELPKDSVTDRRLYNTLEEIEALPPPLTAEEIYNPELYELQRRVIEEVGSDSFLYTQVESPFEACYRVLSFEGLFETMMDSPLMIHALMERFTETAIQNIKAVGISGIIHGIHFNEYPAGAELISEDQFKEFILPYMKRYYLAVKEEGMVSFMEFLGWAEPRMHLLAELNLDILQTESSLKGYQNRLTEYRRILGDDICLLSNSPIYNIIERGSHGDWRNDAEIQAQGIGSKKRFGICPGSPVTWATTPERFKQWHETVQEICLEIAPVNNMEDS